MCIRDRPKGDPDAPLQALIIDSWFDNYVGVVMLVRIVNGVLKPKDKILLMASGATHLCEQTGVFTPKSQQRPHLSAGEVGFILSLIHILLDAWADVAAVTDTVARASQALGQDLGALIAQGPIEQLNLTTNTQPACLLYTSRCV